MELFDVYPRFDIRLSHSRGVYLFDDKNQRYLDLYGGHGVISIGHGHPLYTERLRHQLNRIGYYSNSVIMPGQEELAEKIGMISGYPDYGLFLCNSGAEANENALKLASFHTGREKVLAFRGSFHGRTGAVLNVTDNPNISAPLNRDNYPVEFLELNNSEQLQGAISRGDVAAVIVEGIQGVGGLDMPTTDFLEEVQAACKVHGALLILDEIQSGFGRSGRFFAHQYANVKPDIISVAKGMGNGYPVAAVLINPAIKASYGLLGTTFGGNQLACAACSAVIDVIEKERLIDNARRIGEYVAEQFDGMQEVQIRGKGLMLGLELNFPVKDLRAELAYQERILTGSSSNPNLLRLLPPLTITKEEIMPFVNAIRQRLS